MNQTRKIIFTLSVLALLSALTGCGLFFGSPGEVPRSEIGIPDALVSDAGSRAVTGNAALFEPFRASLEIADSVLDSVNDIIDAINSNVIPNSGEVTLDTGETLTFSTDNARTYTKRIEVTPSGASAPNVQINYTPGSTEGVLYFKEASPAAGELEAMKVYYNATTANPVLTGWLTVAADTAEDSYATSLYFNVTKNSAGNIEVEGGVSYDFTWGADDTTYTTPYTSERTYMYKSYADAAGTKALTGLYFPLSTVADVTEAHDIQQSFLEILYNWLVGNSNWSFSSWETPINNQSDFNTFVLDELNSDTIGDLAFILSLTNPIAFNSTDGYVANGDAVTSAYADLGDLADIDFSLGPDDISGLDPDSSTFAFLED